MTTPAARLARTFHPSRLPFRLVVLLVVSLLAFGPYFATDVISAIETFLIRDLGLNREAIGMMFTLYSVAAIPAVFAAGLVIDRIGVSRAGLLFAMLVALGTLLIAAMPKLPTMYAGRLLLGGGCEPLLVAQNVMLARWFAGRELALSFGVTLTFSRLGSLFAYNSGALLAGRYGFRRALWVAAAICFVSLLAAVAFSAMERLAALLRRRDGHAPRLPQSQPDAPVRLRDIGGFSRAYWLVTLLCVCFYSAVYSFLPLAPDFFHERYHLPLESGEQLGLIAGVIYNLLHPLATAPGTASVVLMASLFLAPLAGAVFDRLEQRPGRHRGGTALLVAGAGLLVPAYLLLSFTHVSPALSMALLGAAFVLAPAALWPLVPYLVPRERQGTAFGLMTTCQNLGLALFTWLNAKLRDLTHGYTASMMMFAVLGGVGFVVAVQLYRLRGDTSHVRNPQIADDLA